MKRIRRVLHPTDFSRASRAAFAAAVSLATRNRAELLVVHVMTPTVLLTGDGYVSPRVYETIEAAARAFGQKRLKALVGRAKTAGARARGVLLEGTPADEIVRAARSRRADLLVMGTHGRTGLPKLFLGSVAGRVVALAPCPVLTVRGR